MKCKHDTKHYYYNIREGAYFCEECNDFVWTFGCEEVK